VNAEITVRAPERKSYVSFAGLDGNSRHVQEVTVPMPGWHTSAVVAFDSVAGLADALRRAAAVHGKYEGTEQADPDRPDWCARYMVDASARGDEG
jgi:hypothetical protein